jgi:hypothetical protein
VFTGENSCHPHVALCCPVVTLFTSVVFLKCETNTNVADISVVLCNANHLVKLVLDIENCIGNLFRLHLLVFLDIQLLLFFSWAVFGRGFPWFSFPLFIWGALLIIHGYFHKPPPKHHVGGKFFL